jgi:uncharacterized repeat protein (TIGR02543 family)
LTINTDGDGSVSRDPDRDVFFYGEMVTLTATPAPGWTFTGWSGDLSGSDNPQSIAITGDTNVTATFVPIEYTLTVNVTGDGTASRNPDQATYHYGDVVELTGNADPGWSFSHWSGDLSGSDNPGSLTITGDTNVTATFTQDEYTLTVNTSGSGSVTGSPDQATYHYGDVVELTGNADPGWSFSHWSGDLTGSDNPKSITMDDNKTVTANFDQIEYDLTVIIVGDGSVTKNPDQTTYHYGDTVGLTANPATGWSFAGWSGDLSGTTNPESIDMYDHRTVTATFTRNEYTLAVDTAGNGSVTKDPDQAIYHYGDVVELTGNADPGWSFSHWSGDLSGSDNPGSLTITGDSNVTATFVRDEYTLTTNVVGNGSVVRDPDQTTYHYGDVVELTAVPEDGWSFAGWSGDLSGSTNPQSITMTDNKNATATFVTAQPLTDVSFTARPDAPMAGAVVTFTAVITPASAQPVTYTWDFGDGSDPVVTTQPQATHVFGTPGQYVVSLVASNGHGSPCTHSAQIEVAAQGASNRRFFLPLIVRG